jgi:arylsulfatase A-like enzyme
VTGQVGSLAAEFQDRGYYTATITSRAHLHPHIMNIPGFDDISAPSLSAQSTDAYDAYRRLRNLLLKHGDRDLFIWLHFFDPHSSYKFHRGYSETFVADYRGDLAPKTTISKGKTIDREEIEYARDLYAGEIYYMDHYIGRSVEAVRGIEPTPRREPFILLIADHGEALGDYIDREGHYAFGHGGVLYNASSRIPLIVVWPGMIPAKVVDDVAGSVDVAPTMLDYVLGYGGFKAQGRSLRAMIEGAAHEPSWTVSYRPRYREREGKFYATDQYAFIQGPYKYIRWDSGDTELYDFMADPAEERDLSGEKPEIVDAYNRDLDQWFKDTPESKGDKRTLSKGEINVLKALGYIQ